MNGEVMVEDMPEFMAAETESAFGLEGLNGYHIMRETFQWPLCMHGHLASYPLGIVMAAQLHDAAKKELGQGFTNISHGPSSPYFDFMAAHVDAQGAEIEPADIIRQATGQEFLDKSAYLKTLEDKKMASANKMGMPHDSLTIEKN